MRSPRRNNTSKLAYKDEAFLDGDAARPLRILAEYLAPLESFRRENIQDTIVFFGSARLSQDGPLGRYYEEARELSRLVTAWSKSLPTHTHRYIVCSGGGGGIMEAANRGASEARRQDHRAQHRIAARAAAQPLHHAGAVLRVPLLLHAEAVVRTPGEGAGGLPGRLRHARRADRDADLAQTRKLERQIPVVLYGSSYWNEVVNFEALVRHGMIDPGDLGLFQYADDPPRRSGFCRPSWRRGRRGKPSPSRGHGTRITSSGAFGAHGRGPLVRDAERVEPEH